jgi:hypothetical protein
MLQRFRVQAEKESPAVSHRSGRFAIRSTQLALGLVVASVGTPCYAQGEAVQECATAYEQAQVFRNAGQLSQAEEQLRICVREVCPDFVKVDCGQWLSDVKREMPSVVFTAEDSDGKELQNVKVTVDGVAVQEALDGKALELDPGQHDVRFDYNGRAITQKLIVRQGEKNRVVLASFRTAADQDADGIGDSLDACPTHVGPLSNQGCPVSQPGVPVVDDGTDPRLVGAIVAGGIGIAGIAGFAVLGLTARAKGQRGADDCGDANGCGPVELQNYKDEESKWLLPANISAGVGGVGLAAAVVLFLLYQTDDAPATQSSAVAPAWTFAAAPTLGGAAFSLHGRF